MTTTYDPWVNVWTVWKMHDGELVSFGKEYPTEAEAQAVADGLIHTETEVKGHQRVNSDPLPEHLSVTWDDIETGFHEYASSLTKEEVDADVETSYYPDFANWAVGMKAAQEWLAAHDARVRAEALRGAASFWSENPDEVDDETPADTRNWLRTRADQIEEATE